MSPEQLHNEKELLNLIANGDEAAFRKLFNIYMPLLYPSLFQIIKVGSVTEDIVQETFLKLWIYRDKLTEIENPKAWIFRIGYHQAFTYLRKNAVHQKATKNIAAANNTGSLRNATEESLAFKTLAAQLKLAVSKLPLQQKRVYQLSREHGLKIDEIADEMNLSQQTIKNTLSRALKFIREHIKQSGLLFLILMALLYKK